MVQLRYLILIAAIALLPGCALVDVYLMARYDANEYGLVNNVKTKAELAQEYCANKTVMQQKLIDMYGSAVEFKNFTAYIPRNKEANGMAVKLAALTKDAKDYYINHDKVSEAFCKMKLQQIVKSSDAIMETLGKKPR